MDFQKPNLAFCLFGTVCTKSHKLVSSFNKYYECIVIVRILLYRLGKWLGNKRAKAVKAGKHVSLLLMCSIIGAFTFDSYKDFIYLLIFTGDR